MNEYTFTFGRENEERKETIEADNFEDAAEKACALCKLWRCKITHVAWFEDNRRQQSIVQYT
jgi:hypothetical protein